MPQNSNYSNNPDSNGELAPSTNTTTEETSLEVFAEVVDKALDKAVEENPTKQWMEVAAPILKSGGKTVAIILSLGFVAIPLTLFGSPWIGIILATGATITAVCSCLMVTQ
ncbi:hypothetical protein SD81_040235 [Tolypothrix campylonemoides VB511288]|nr:hypothetical protein SD81_040235 [Tolypothrix campylonemoides VB511288]